MFMKHLESFNLFKKFFDKREIHKICKRYDINNYTINSDGSIDVNGTVYLYHKGLTNIPLKFNKVSGSFICSNNNLISLDGCPKEVGGEFNCSDNQLISLDGCPKEVGDDFDCSINPITTMKGVSKIIKGNFTCRNCKLENLNFCPEAQYYDFSYNKIKNFNGFPEFNNSNVDFHGNDVDDIYYLFRLKSCIRWINEYDVIQGDNVIFDRLEEVFLQLNKTVPSINFVKRELGGKYNVI